MRITTETLFNGHRTSIMLVLPVPTGTRETSREFLDAETWNRKTASEALDLIESVYGIPRSRVRFSHR